MKIIECRQKYLPDDVTIAFLIELVQAFPSQFRSLQKFEFFPDDIILRMEKY